MTTLEKLENLLKEMESGNKRFERICNSNLNFNSHLKLIVCTGRKTTGKFDLRKYNKMII
jgi:hypothetical protein